MDLSRFVTMWLKLPDPTTSSAGAGELWPKPGCRLRQIAIAGMADICRITLHTIHWSVNGRNHMSDRFADKNALIDALKRHRMVAGNTELAERIALIGELVNVPVGTAIIQQG